MESKYCPAGKCECKWFSREVDGTTIYCEFEDNLQTDIEDPDNPQGACYEVCPWPSRQQRIINGRYPLVDETPVVEGEGAISDFGKLVVAFSEYQNGYAAGRADFKRECVTTLEDLYCRTEHTLDDAIAAISALKKGG